MQIKRQTVSPVTQVISQKNVGTPAVFLLIFKIFNGYLKIWPPLAVNFLALWIWEIMLMGANWNDNNRNDSYFGMTHI